MNLNWKKIIAVFFAFGMAVGITGCSAVKETAKTLQAAQGSTAAWLYSDIEGQLTAEMTIREQDDFHAAVNRDWIVSHKPDADGNCIDLLSGEKEMKKQLRLLIRDPESTGYRSNTSVGMSAEEIAHAGELVARFAEEVENTEKRASLGVEPLRPYIECIRQINSLSEMSEFIAGGTWNIPGSPLTDISVGATKTDPGTFRVLVKPMNEGYLTLQDPVNYNWIDEDAVFAKQKKSEITRTVLRKLGYTESEVQSILNRCYRLECRLAVKMQKKGVVSSDDYEEKYSEELPIADADALTGAYPLAAYLEANGLDADGKVTVYQPDYMKALADIYTESGLEEVKAFYIVNTVYSACDLLDPETAAQVRQILTRTNASGSGNTSADGSGNAGADNSANADDSANKNSGAGLPVNAGENVDDTAENENTSAAPMDVGTGAELTEEEKATDALIDNYIRQYLSAPFDMMYIAAYLNSDQKEALTELTHTIKAELRDILSTEEWMSEESRTQCVEKLDAMAERILYPDEYISCLPLDFTGDENLVDMVQSILSYNICRRAGLIGKPRTRNEWDLMQTPTTVANAFNSLQENAIIIPSGITAGGFTFDLNAPYEQNLARMGTILGHEMTHGFDDNGTKYDKTGIELSVLNRNTLMTAADRNTFSSKTYHLSAWYTAQSPAPGMPSYSSNISGEAIADMGGMKCALLAAEQSEGFDYDLFFRSYAELWRKVCTENVERLYAKQDVHPLAFFRTNVTLQQFDKFMETYGVQEGDGMYLPPENRIIIW